MEKMTKEIKMLESLLVDETDIIKDLAKIIEHAKEIFVIEKATGKIIFRNFGQLTDRQRISALLIERYFAGKLGLIEDNMLGISEIANILGRPKTALSGPIRDLLSKSYVEKLSNRKYLVNYNRIKDIFEDLFTIELSLNNEKNRDDRL